MAASFRVSATAVPLGLDWLFRLDAILLARGLAQIEGVSGRDRLGDILTKALGLTIPSSVLSLADDLIE
jgi:hypothetical protein